MWHNVWQLKSFGLLELSKSRLCINSLISPGTCSGLELIYVSHILPQMWSCQVRSWQIFIPTSKKHWMFKTDVFALNRPLCVPIPACHTPCRSNLTPYEVLILWGYYVGMLIITAHTVKLHAICASIILGCYITKIFYKIVRVR